MSTGGIDAQLGERPALNAHLAVVERRRVRLPGLKRTPPLASGISLGKSLTYSVPPFVKWRESLRLPGWATVV